MLVWVDRQPRSLPSGSAVLDPVAAYSRKATDAVVAVFFTLAATWYWVSERDRMIELLTGLAPEPRRAKARTTYLEIDRRLGAYTRVKLLMVGAIGLVLSTGLYAVGLHYWLLVGGFVSLVEIIPVIGPLIGGLLVVTVGLLLVFVAVRMVQSYVVNPHVLGHSVSLSPLVRLRRRRPVRRLRRRPRRSGDVRGRHADRRARCSTTRRPHRRGARSPSPAIGAGVGILATLRKSRWYGSAWGQQSGGP